MIKKVFLLIFLIILSCVKYEKDNLDISGLWIMDDTQKMISFLGLKIEPKGYYCLEINKEVSSGKVKFINTENIYVVEIKKMNDNKIKIIKDNRSREAFISSDKLNDKETYLYLHFNDSSPYNEKNFSYDGIKTSQFNTIDECIKSLEEDYEFAQEEEGGLDPDEVKQKEASKTK